MKKEENLKRALLVFIVFSLILFMLPNVLAPKPYCGDGKCFVKETALNCPADCGCVPYPETCNNLDDDCNGIIDNGLTQVCGVTDVGACQYGVSTCSAGVWGSCVGNIDPIAEICEGSIDENCNGLIDEGCECINGQTQQCGTDVGKCEYGSQTCSGGVWGACVGEIPPVIETCNNIDDDCNGIIDNGLTQVCGVTDVGACQYGVSTCSAGVWGSCVGSIDPTTEVCNGIDDNCNGITDDGFDQDSCEEKCSFVWTGNGGSLNCCGDDAGEDNPFQPTETITDGRDNDCDGSVDEGGTGGTDYTDKSCNIDGSASPTKVKCGLGTVDMNEDATDATFDSCTDGTISGFMYIEDIFVDATTVLITDTVQVKCKVRCYSSGTEYAILYNNGYGWVNKQYGNCIGSGFEDKIISIPVDDVVGTHYFRCWESYLGCDATTKCCSSSYADNDDMSINVISGSQTCAGTDANCGVYPNCISCPLDTCSGTDYLNYFCSGTSCSYTSDSCTDCSCTCGGYNILESIANGNCNDGKNNDCDANTDCNDPGCYGYSTCCNNGVKDGNEVNVDCGGSCISGTETGSCTGGVDNDKDCLIDCADLDCSSDPACAGGTGGELVAWGQDLYGRVSDTPAGNDFVAVAAGPYHNVALKSDGSLVAWGLNNYGQVSNTPTGNNFVAAATGGYHSVALKNDGSLVSWGQNGYGQVYFTPTGNGFTAVSAGLYHSVALKNDGSVVAWGLDSYNVIKNTPTSKDFVAVAAGAYHNVALKLDGSLVSWGYDSYSQISDTPTGNDFIAITAGHSHNVALKSDGSLVSWGLNSYGTVSDTPIGNDFTALAAGLTHSLALKSDGSLIAWGYDGYGQISDTPTGNDFIAVSTGYNHNVAIRGV